MEPRFAIAASATRRAGRRRCCSSSTSRGNLDNWDPALVDLLAADREVILLANRGVGGSTGVVPDNVEDMARDALRFIDALGLAKIDLLGFSLGGYAAQEIALVRPRLVRRLVLAGTAPQGAPGIHRWSDEVYALATPDVPNPEGFLMLFFSRSEESREKGREYFARITARSANPDEQTDLAARDAQLEAITRWGIPDPSKLARLAAITQPTLVANGDNDKMMITGNSRLLAEHLPDARLRIYPDSGHGFLDQYPEDFGHDESARELRPAAARDPSSAARSPAPGGSGSRASRTPCPGATRPCAG
jgi:pimeloyl-ACP methyl ester carboxylesterase